MKRFSALLLAALLLIGSISLNASSLYNGIQVFYKEKQIEIPVSPQTESWGILVPMENIYKEFGYTVSWDTQNQIALLVKGSNIISITLDSCTAKVNGKIVKMAGKARKKGNNTLIPIAFIAQSTGKYLFSESDTDYYFEDKDSNEYDYMEKPYGGIACGAGKYLLYTDSSDKGYSYLYMTTFEGSTSTCLIGQSGLLSSTSYRYIISPYGSGKAIVSTDSNTLYTVDADKKTAQTYTSYNDKKVALDIQKVYSGSLYFEQNADTGEGQNNYFFCKNIKSGSCESLLNLTTIENKYSCSFLDFAVDGDTAMLLFLRSVKSGSSTSYLTEYFTYQIKSKKLNYLGSGNGAGRVQVYNHTFYIIENYRIGKMNTECDTPTYMSSDSVYITDFIILNNTFYYMRRISERNGDIQYALCRSPLSFTYSAAIFNAYLYDWNVVGNHVIYRPKDAEKTYMMNTDGTNRVILRQARKYVEVSGKK